MEAKRGTKGMREKCGKNGKTSMKKKRKRGEEGGGVSTVCNVIGRRDEE